MNMSIFGGAKPFRSKMKKEKAPKADRLYKNLQFK
jgi:hypothetical protein